MSQVIGTDANACASCGLALTGPFCSACGEEAIRPDRLTVRHFFTRTVLEEGFDLDGKLWRTVRGLLFRPGFLTAEYWSGRRRGYIGPFKLLLVAIVSYALFTQSGLRITWSVNDVALSLAPVATAEGVSVAETVRRLDRFGLLSPLAARKTDELQDADDRLEFHRRLAQFAEPMSFTNVVLLATVLGLMFWRRRLLFAQHCTFAMHCMAFVLIVTLVLGRAAIELLQSGALVFAIILNVVLSWWQLIYIGVAVRRFYLADDRRRLLPAVKAAAVALILFVANGVFLTGVQMAAAAVALWLA